MSDPRLTDLIRVIEKTSDVAGRVKLLSELARVAAEATHNESDTLEPDAPAWRVVFANLKRGAEGILSLYESASSAAAVAFPVVQKEKMAQIGKRLQQLDHEFVMREREFEKLRGNQEEELRRDACRTQAFRVRQEQLEAWEARWTQALNDAEMAKKAIAALEKLQLEAEALDANGSLREAASVAARALQSQVTMIELDFATAAKVIDAYKAAMEANGRVASALQRNAELVDFGVPVPMESVEAGRRHLYVAVAAVETLEQSLTSAQSSLREAMDWGEKMRKSLEKERTGQGVSKE